MRAPTWWRRGDLALLVVAVLQPALLLLRRRTPADAWQRAELDSADAGPQRRDEDSERRRLADDGPRRQLVDAVECSEVTFERKTAINDMTVTNSDKYEWFQVRAADIDGDGTDDMVAVETKKVG